jgi:hypothetical protein
VHRHRTNLVSVRAHGTVQRVVRLLTSLLSPTHSSLLGAPAESRLPVIGMFSTIAGADESRGARAASGGLARKANDVARSGSMAWTTESSHNSL